MTFRHRQAQKVDKPSKSTDFITITHTNTPTNGKDSSGDEVGGKRKRPKYDNDNIKRLLSFIINRCNNQKGMQVPACCAVTAIAKIYDVFKSTVSLVYV